MPPYLLSPSRRLPALYGQIPWVSKKVLVGQLRQLKVAGLVARTVHNGFSPKSATDSPKRGRAGSHQEVAQASAPKS